MQTLHKLYVDVANEELSYDLFISTCSLGTHARRLTSSQKISPRSQLFLHEFLSKIITMASSEKSTPAPLLKRDDEQVPLTKAQLILMTSLQRLTGPRVPTTGKGSANAAGSSKAAAGGSAGVSVDPSKTGTGKGRARIPRGDGKPRLCLMGQRR